MTNCCGFPSRVPKRGLVIETGRANSGIVSNGQRSKAFELATTTVQLLVGGGFVQFDSFMVTRRADELI